MYFNSHIELHPTDTSAAGLRKPWRYLAFLLVFSELLRIVLAQLSLIKIVTAIVLFNPTNLITLVHINCFDEGISGRCFFSGVLHALVNSREHIHVFLLTWRTI